MSFSKDAINNLLDVFHNKQKNTIITMNDGRKIMFEKCNASSNIDKSRYDAVEVNGGNVSGIDCLGRTPDIIGTILYDRKDEKIQYGSGKEDQPQVEAEKVESSDTVIEKIINLVDESTPHSKNVETIIDIIDNSDVKKTSFLGDTTNLLSHLLYLLKKYPNACMPFFGYNASRGISYLTWYFENESSRGRLDVPDNFRQAFSSCVLNQNIRFIIGTISLRNQVNGHVNCFLIDLKDPYTINGQSVEIFEPNGSVSDDFFNQNLYITKLRQLFIQQLGISTFYSTRDFCPTISFQKLQSDEIGEILASDPGGFCQAWSLWWIEFRLKNAEIKKTRVELVKLAIEQIRSKKSLTKFIRNYAESIVKQRDELYEGLYANDNGEVINMYKIVEHDFYKLESQREKLLYEIYKKKIEDQYKKEIEDPSNSTTIYKEKLIKIDEEIGKVKPVYLEIRQYMNNIFYTLMRNELTKLHGL